MPTKSLALAFLAIVTGCASTPSYPDPNRIGGTAIGNRSKERLTDFRVVTYRDSREEHFQSSASLEPYAGSYWWPRERGPSRTAEFTWTDGHDQTQTQTIDVGDPRDYRGKTIVYVFSGATWKAEAAPSTYALPNLRPSR